MIDNQWIGKIISIQEDDKTVSVYFLKSIQGGQVAKNLSRRTLWCITYIGIVSLNNLKGDMANQVWDLLSTF